VNPLAVAAVWLGTGAAGALAVTRLRVRRLAIVVPLAGLAAVVVGGAGSSPIHFLSTTVTLSSVDRAGQGLLAAAAVSLAAAVILAPSLTGSESFAIGMVGGATVVALATDAVVVWALALTAAVATLALRWITTTPNRATLAAGRVAGGGAAALLAAGLFLPLPEVTGPRPVMVAILLASGLAALMALLPLGGWAAGSYASLRGIDFAPWQLLLAPAVLLSTDRLAGALPTASIEVFQRALLAMALATAVWSGLQAARAHLSTRYGRLFIADLALAAAAVGGTRSSVALTGGLLIVLTHLLLGPLLLPLREEPRRRRPQRVAWALLSGLPPTPSFWGRFLVLEALAQTNASLLYPALVAAALVFVAATLSCLPGQIRRPGSSSPAGLLAPAVSWLLVVGAIALGLAPQGITGMIFGSQ
jgi:hypothetical protein